MSVFIGDILSDILQTPVGDVKLELVAPGHIHTTAMYGLAGVPSEPYALYGRYEVTLVIHAHRPLPPPLPQAGGWLIEGILCTSCLNYRDGTCQYTAALLKGPAAEKIFANLLESHRP